MSSDPLQRRYTSDAARAYEERRRDTPRWKAENAAFANMIEAARPRSVLDCPVGTGRWFEWYRSLPGPIIAIDKSPDMLAEARLKIDDHPKYRLIEGDIFTYDFAQHAGEIDLVVCVRFLNWVPWEDAAEIIRRLSTTESPHLIVGATVAGGSGATRMRQRFEMARRKVKARLSSSVQRHVHSRPDLIKSFNDNGWKIVAQCQTFERTIGVNDFYSLQRR
jgi:SAM-dependent methyltransferase